MKMIRDAKCEWLTFECQPFHHWANCTPLGKSQTLIAWILRQGREKQSGYGWSRRRYTALDILINGIAADLWVTYGQPRLKTPYYRAVSIGRSVWWMLRAEFKEYEQDFGHGTTRLQRVCLTRKVRLRSRNACQRIEAAIRKQTGEFMNAHHEELVALIQKKGLLCCK